MTGWVFNIQRYSLHDGAGIRTVVFLKGCPLRCTWCSNPESQQGKPEMAIDSRKCLGQTQCGLCENQCASAAIGFRTSGEVAIDLTRCTQCLHCVSPCPTNALHRFGEQMSVGQVLDRVEAEAVFYQRSGGGLTVSGGEPLMQGEFTLSLLREAKRRSIDTLLETCGDGTWSALRQIAGYTDGIYFDVKSLNDASHRRFTQRGNRQILSNLLHLRNEFPALPIHVRTPLIPGFNSTREDINAIIDFILPLKVSYEILPYHRLGRDKYRLLGREYPLTDAMLPEGYSEEIIGHARRRCAGRYGAPESSTRARK